MKFVQICLGCLITVSLLDSCKKDTTTVTLVGNWVSLYAYDGNVRSEAVAFSVLNKGYVGLGYDGKTRLKDFWKYDPSTKTWTQVATFPGQARTSATAFATSDKGYIATGNNGTYYLCDTWEYDPLSNAWKQKASIWDKDSTFGARYDAVSFCINNIGYLGTGYDGRFLKDFWRFDPSVGDSGEWKKWGSMGGNKRTGATAFVINNIAYVCCGVDNAKYVSDFWRFDPNTGTFGDWQKMNDIRNVSTETFDDEYAIVREYGVAFVIENKAYLTAGINNSILSDTWEYDPYPVDRWTKKTPFEGTARYGAVSFSLRDTIDKGYILTGRNSYGRFDDFWEFKPNDAVNDKDN
jgi:N-acetylneuraminic acid mutarotase